MHESLKQSAFAVHDAPTPPWHDGHLPPTTERVVSTFATRVTPVHFGSAKSRVAKRWAYVSTMYRLLQSGASVALFCTKYPFCLIQRCFISIYAPVGVIVKFPMGYASIPMASQVTQPTGESVVGVWKMEKAAAWSVVMFHLAFTHAPNSSVVAAVRVITTKKVSSTSLRSGPWACVVVRRRERKAKSAKKRTKERFIRSALWGEEMLDRMCGVEAGIVCYCGVGSSVVNFCRKEKKRCWFCVVW